MYKLKKLIFKSFKLFDEKPYEINFDCADLIVFDGPNGYGKTTVYDAIELAITGNIRRLISLENKQNPGDVVVAHKDRKDTEIRLTLSASNSDDNLEIVRRLKKDLPTGAKKISNFSGIWEFYIVDKGIETQLSQDDFNRIIGSQNLQRDFSLFHYVEQEDSAHFLKSNNEVDRAKALAGLFGDTTKAQEWSKKLVGVEKLIATKIKEFDKEKNNLDVQYNLGSIADQKNNGNDDLYKVLLPWLEKGFEWDAQVVERFTLEKRDDFLSQLNSIKGLTEHKDLFLLFSRYKGAANQTSILRSFILHYKYVDDLSSLKLRENNLRVMREFLEKVGNDFIDRLSPKEDHSIVLNLLEFQEVDEFKRRLEELADFKNRNLNSVSLYDDLIKYRSQLHDHFHKFDDAECPYCGTNFETRDKLIADILKKEESLKSHLTEDGKTLFRLKDNYQNDFLNSIRNKAQSYISSINAPSVAVLSSLESASSIKQRLDDLHKWLIVEGIEFTDLFFEYTQELPDTSDADGKLEVLRTRILEKTPELPESYIAIDDNYNFDSIYSTYFNRNADNLKILSIEEVDQKIQYILKVYSSSLFNVYERYNLLKKNLIKLKQKKEKVGTVRKKINSCISRYQKKLIKDIEVPFYIYSGKLLQTHQAGMGSGIFIKDKTGGEELKNIRLVSDWDSDHDVLNTMSSGQIAAIVITLYLALNKVYAHGFQPILIDDPVQTMDEINMISLVELLRNEFSNRQIILSTHEDHVSKYFLYKYLKYGASVKQINLMERKEYKLA